MLKTALLTIGLFALNAISSLYGGAAFNFAEATKITSLPFIINAPGNYYLAKELTYTNANGANAVAIVINASEVVLDLNGETLKADGIEKVSNVGIGIAVINQEDVTIQNGDIDGFGAFGILFAGSDGRREHNFKNEAENVRFNGDQVGVMTVSGSLVDVENCFFEGGSVGIYDVATLGGDRFQKDSFQSQAGVEALNLGIGLISLGGVGVLSEDNLFADEQTAAAFLQDRDDRLRFNTEINCAQKFIGGRSQGAADD
jgi:hypothetical protein